MKEDKSVKVRAHTNIALVKYWGKKDENLFLPFNSSLSMTLSEFYTDTKLTLLDNNELSSFYLNGEEQSLYNKKELFNYIEFLISHLSKEKYSYKIETYNNVVTSNGLASSSSGYAALTYAFVSLLKPNLSLKEVSRLTRRGSGSSTRSIYGGFVEWEKGSDDLTSYAVPIDENPSIDLKTVFIIFSHEKKKVSSREGMSLCVKTSSCYSSWVKEAEKDLILIKKAIKENDFSSFGLISEINSLAMHQTTLESKPSFSYYSDETKKGIQVVRNLRQIGIECYFSIDAGPNICVLCQSKNVDIIKQTFKKTFPKADIISSGFGEGVKVIK